MSLITKSYPAEPAEPTEIYTHRQSVVHDVWHAEIYP